MKHLFLTLALVMVGCASNYKYGIHKDDWALLTDSEKKKVILDYKEQQRIKEQRRLLKEELEAKRIADAEEQLKKDDMELIDVTVYGGEIKNKPFAPQRFTIGYNEKLKIPFKLGSSLKETQHIDVYYANAKLIFGSDRDSSYDRAIELDYNKSWCDGQLYEKLKNSSIAKYHADGINIKIRRHRFHQSNSHGCKENKKIIKIEI